MSIAYLPAPAGHDTQREPYRRWPSPPDPGDLSRRVLQRRTELRLSREQVAARSGMSSRYLEYLERYPGRPGSKALRRLASALRTTPAELLGAGANVPTRPMPHEPVTRKLMRAECRLLIAPGGIGRIAFGHSSQLTVLPVNYTMLDGTVVIRVGEGTIIEGHSDGEVAFEVDHIDAALQQGWSVLIRGQAHRVRHSAELNRVLAGPLPWPWPAGERDAFIRVVADEISGRRIEVMLSLHRVTFGPLWPGPSALAPDRSAPEPGTMRTRCR